MKNKYDKRKLKSIIMIAILLVTISCSIIFIGNNKAQQTFALENSNNIIPKPLSYKEGQGKFTLKKYTSIYVKGNTEEETEEISKIAEFLKDKLKPATGFELNIT